MAWTWEHYPDHGARATWQRQPLEQPPPWDRGVGRFTAAANRSQKYSAVQWWQISPAGAVLQLGRIDDPSGNLFYAYPSLAVNREGDALIGYGRFSATQYAGAGYALRCGTDPAGTLRADTVLKAGEAAYYETVGETLNRWGDYSQTMVDPANDFGLWTIQEYAYPPAPAFNRWSTWWGSVTPGACLLYHPWRLKTGRFLRREESRPAAGGHRERQGNGLRPWWCLTRILTL